MRKQGKRRKYRANPDASLDVLCRNNPLLQEEVTALGLQYHEAFAVLRGDTEANEGHFCMMSVAINTALVLAEMGIGTEFVKDVEAAQEGLARCHIRGTELGRWALDGDAIRDIEMALALHDEQMRVATKGQIREALAEVARRINIGNVLTVEKLAA